MTVREISMEYSQAYGTLTCDLKFINQQGKDCSRNYRTQVDAGFVEFSPHYLWTEMSQFLRTIYEDYRSNWQDD